MCILALNIINEKIYTFLWFWFILLTIFTAIDVIVRVGILLVPQIRTFIVQSRLSAPQKDDADIIAQRCTIGDWLLIDFLSKNMDTMVFSSFVAKVSKTIGYSHFGSQRYADETMPMMPLSKSENDFKS